MQELMTVPVELIGQILAGIVAAITILLFYIKKVWPWIKSKIIKMLGIGQVQKTVEGLHLTLEIQDGLLLEIKKQLIPNDGKSIRDSLTRIENKQTFFESFLKTQMNATDKSIFVTDKNGLVTWVNRSHQKLTGFAPAQMMGHGWINLVSPNERELVFEKWGRAVKNIMEFDEFITYITPDGVEYPVHVVAYVMKNEIPMQLLGHIGEITIMEKT